MDVEISIGDYVLTGGAAGGGVLRCGVPPCREYCRARTLLGGIPLQRMLEYPQYTPARIFGRTVPEVLLSGHHAKIEEWRKEQALLRTKEKRPDLYEKFVAKGDASGLGGRKTK